MSLDRGTPEGWEAPTVVAGSGGREGLVELVDVVEGLEPEELFPEGADEAFRHSVALGLGDEGRGGANPKEGELLLEVAAQKLAAMVVPQGESGPWSAGLPTPDRSERCCNNGR